MAEPDIAPNLASKGYDPMRGVRSLAVLTAVVVATIVLVQWLVLSAMVWAVGQAGLPNGFSGAFSWFWLPGWVLPEIILVLGLVTAWRRSDVGRDEVQAVWN